MDPICYIYDVDFKHLADDHELGTGEEINRKVDFVSLDALYNVQSDRNAYSLEYDIFTWQT